MTPTLITTPTPSLPDESTRAQMLLASALQNNVQKTHELALHARAVQDNMTWASWINEQHALAELAELRARRRRMQITWALRGGPLPKTKVKKEA